MYFNLVIHMTLEKDFHLIWIFINIQTFCSACMCAKSLRSYLTLCDPMDCSPPGSSVHGIFQASTLEWVAISYSRGNSQPRDGTWVSCIDRQTVFHCATWEALIMLILGYLYFIVIYDYRFSNHLLVYRKIINLHIYFITNQLTELSP